jgi:hypothetical protein
MGRKKNSFFCDQCHEVIENEWAERKRTHAKWPNELAGIPERSPEKRAGAVYRNARAICGKV